MQQLINSMQQKKQLTERSVSADNLLNKDLKLLCNEKMNSYDPKTSNNQEEYNDS